MLQRILVIILLMMVEVSTVRECFSDCKQQIEAQDLEDNNESEDVNKEVILEKYLIAGLYFQFKTGYDLSNNNICDETSAIITNPFRVIDSPPPKK